MILRRLVRLIGIFSLLFVLIGFFPAIGDICSALYYKDIYVNFDKYHKRYILIDSLTYMNTDGSDTDRVDGYSKELNNYKTIILFGKIKRDNHDISLGVDSVGNLNRYVWYRKGIDFAIPGKKNKKEFPIKDFLYKNLKIPVFWFLAIIVSFMTYKISKKSKLFKKVNENENNH